MASMPSQWLQRVPSPQRRGTPVDDDHGAPHFKQQVERTSGFGLKFEKIKVQSRSQGLQDLGMKRKTCRRRQRRPPFQKGNPMVASRSRTRPARRLWAFDQMQVTSSLGYTSLYMQKKRKFTLTPVSKRNSSAASTCDKC